MFVIKSTSGLYFNDAHGFCELESQAWHTRIYGSLETAENSLEHAKKVYPKEKFNIILIRVIEEAIVR